MPGLSVTQASVIPTVYPSAREIYCSAAAQLYKAEGGFWNFTGTCGVISLILDKSNEYYLKIFTLTTKRICFEQVLYQGFSFQQPLPFFITFEGNNCVLGVSFADESEAVNFCDNLDICVSELSGESLRYSPRGECETKREGPQIQISPRHQDELCAQEAATNKESGSNIKVVQTSSRRKSEIMKQSLKKKSGKRSIFGFGKNKKKDLVIGCPTNFDHRSHIGWDVSTGFDTRNIPPEWRKLFPTAYEEERAPPRPIFPAPPSFPASPPRSTPPPVPPQRTCLPTAPPLVIPPQNNGNNIKRPMPKQTAIPPKPAPPKERLSPRHGDDLYNSVAEEIKKRREKIKIVEEEYQEDDWTDSDDDNSPRSGNNYFRICC